MDKRNAVIRKSRAAKAAIEALDNVLAQTPVERGDLLLLLDKVSVYEDHIDIRLREKVRELLHFA